MQPFPTVIHVGANKAGSTTLQRALFARHPAILSLGKPDPNEGSFSAVESVMSHCDIRRSNQLQIDIEILKKQWVSAAAAPGDGRVPVFSFENLIRPYLYGGSDPSRLPRLLSSMIGPLKVVIVARNQLRLVESMYLHKANSSQFMTPDEWLSSDPEWFAFGFRFASIANAWSNTIGKDNVGVFLFEELANDSDAFARKLCEFIGIDPGIGAALLRGKHENVRKSDRTQRYAYLRSRFFPRLELGRLLPVGLRASWRRAIEGGGKAKVDLPKEWESRMLQLYRSDNLVLEREYGVDVAKYGYPI